MSSELEFLCPVINWIVLLIPQASSFRLMALFWWLFTVSWPYLVIQSFVLPDLNWLDCSKYLYLSCAKQRLLQSLKAEFTETSGLWFESDFRDSEEALHQTRISKVTCQSNLLCSLQQDYISLFHSSGYMRTFILLILCLWHPVSFSSFMVLIPLAAARGGPRWKIKWFYRVVILNYWTVL